MAFYWYALFHRKKAIPITFREQVFYRDIGNVARENSGKKGPISYFCLGNVPQSTPPSTNAGGFEGTVGIAWMGTACDTSSGLQVNINMKVRTMLASSSPSPMPS